MVRHIINVCLFITYLLLAALFVESGFPWWSHLIIGFGMVGIVIFTNMFLDVVDG